MSYIGNVPLVQSQRLVIDHATSNTDTYFVAYTPGFIDVILNGTT